MAYLSHNKRQKKFVYVMYELDQQLRIYFVLENLDKIMQLRFNFDACPMHSPFGFVHLTHQNLRARALFCLNSLAKVNTQLLIYKYETYVANQGNLNVNIRNTLILVQWHNNLR